MLVLTAGIGVGAGDVSQESSLDQFQTDSTEADKLDYIEGNFSADQNTTTGQLIVRESDGNVLDAESLRAQLAVQQALRDNETIEESLNGDEPTTGVANVVATAALQRDAAEDVRETADEIQTLNESVQQRQAALEANRTELERQQAALTADRQALANRTDELNATSERLRSGLTTLQSNPNASVRATFDEVNNDTAVALNETDFGIYSDAATQLRNAPNESVAQSAFELGTQGVLREEFAAAQRRGTELEERGEQLQERGETLEQRGDELAADADRLESLGDELETQQAELENASEATLDEQQTKLASMNESAIDETLGAVLTDDGDGGGGAFAFLPSSYDPGSTEATATTIFVTQNSDTEGSAPGAASDELVDAQLAIQDLVQSRDDPGEYLVFGTGIISDETTASQEESLQIVGPLAGIFVLIALVIAYRDPVDIVLGLVGIVAVLLWTFGFMGWADIGFNQIMIAVPVLLIGLSIDYAIHIFMRHREERQAADDAGPRRAMTIALGGVGAALVWVTATTVIGFLSNLTSPVGPIQDFGVVSSVGITAAFLIFGILIPALKVELDELLEGYGIDRQMTAFGTGGGAFSSVLSIGSTAARRAPAVVIALALVITAAGGIGATQVDTSFSQDDFLAEQPPDWMDDLPEAIQPSNYTAKDTLNFVNENFVRENSQAQILVESNESSVDDPGLLADTDDATAFAADRNVTQNLSNGEADITAPLTTMRDVAANNETFNQTFTAADTDGDGVPEENVTAVYDSLYEVAPSDARQILVREDGDYEALRLIVSIRGDASGDNVTSQMRDVADEIDDDDYDVTATGSPIINKIVQDDLLDTVVTSLIVTLVAVFLFLMLSYRVTEGSASLGGVTLLPVLFSVAWILGTMFLIDISFNVVTGTITSLTVGLGVAYSIHLSERYNQELERTRDVWGAMDRAVTGTGGALLGSAATTAGGFGVLVFAILPPLQDFGTITAMTIVYAFLASVLVLPSMLVVWTRAAGPDWAAAQITDDEPPSTGETESTQVTPDANGSPAGDESIDQPAADGEPANGAQPAGSTAETGSPEGQWEDGEFVPASVVDSGLRAHREIDGTHVAPGTTVEATIHVEDAAGRFVLREEASGPELAVVETEPEPVDVVRRDAELNVAWDAAGDARLDYEIHVPEDTADGTTFALSGTLMTDAEDRDVRGDQTLTVVANLFERIVSAGEVSDADLQLARERYEADVLSEPQFDRIYRAWLRDGGQRELTDGSAGERRGEPTRRPSVDESAARPVDRDGGEDVGDD